MVAAAQQRQYEQEQTCGERGLCPGRSSLRAAGSRDSLTRRGVTPAPPIPIGTVDQEDPPPAQAAGERTTDQRAERE